MPNWGMAAETPGQRLPDRDCVTGRPNGPGFGRGWSVGAERLGLASWRCGVSEGWAGGDDTVAVFGVGYGDGPDGGSPPEGLCLVFVVVNGMVGGFDADAG